jgi:5-(carboxyamino)imidazole ribonucleotide synthase
VDVVTYEFENVPTSALDRIEARRRSGPAGARLPPARTGSRRSSSWLPSALPPPLSRRSRRITTCADGARADRHAAILKTRRFGYDGKGQVADHGALRRCRAAHSRRLPGRPAILEGFVDFSREVSVIAARGNRRFGRLLRSGREPARGRHPAHDDVPAASRPAQRSDAVLIAARILNALDYVGVMGVELFVTRGSLVVNEFAPRVHNSGHWTQNGCVIDQFEQHIRAIAGLAAGRRNAAFQRRDGEPDRR